MPKKKKYHVLAEGKKMVKSRLRSGRIRFYEGYGTLFSGTFATLQKAKIKATQLKRNSDINDIRIIELDPEGGFHYTTGRQHSSGYYYGESKERFQYKRREIYEWSR